MRGQTVVLDSNNLSAVIADATGEPLEVSPEIKTETKADPEIKEEVKAEKSEVRPEIDPDDVEGEDGLTPRQKRDLTDKMQKAIGKKHRALREAEEFAAEQYSERKLAEQRAERLERELARFQASQQQTQPQVKSDDGKPARDQFQTDEDYQNAVIDWRVNQQLKAKEAEIAKQKEQERLEQIRMSASERVEKAKEIVPDFAEVLENADVEIPAHIAGYMQESEMLPELAYFLAQNPERLDKIRRMSVANALVEIGKIESRLEPFGKKTEQKQDAPKASQTKTVPEPSSERKPRAAEPITPLSVASNSQVQKDFKDMNIREAIQDWQAKKRVNLNRRQRH